MNILLVSFSINGAMGDNFKLVVSYLRKTEHKINILTNVDTGLQSTDNSPITEIPFNRSKIFDFINPISYAKILFTIIKEKYDIILFLSFHPVNIFVTKFVPAKKTFVYLHDHDHHSGVAKFDSFFHQIQYNYVYSKEIQIIVSSNFMKNEIMKKHNKIPSNRIHVIYLGLLDNLVFQFNDEIEEDIDVLFFGRIEYYKGIDTLVKSYEIYKNNYSCVIVGKGSLEIFGIKKLPTTIKHVNEYVSDKELASYIMRSKVIVMPYRDATGTQVIQSVFYYGKPIVATNVGCFSEYISTDIDGIIVNNNEKDINDAINLLLNNDELRKRLGRNGKNKISILFSNKKINELYLEAFQSILR